MKTNKTIKWLLAVGFVAVIAGCDSSGSGESGSNDGSAAGLDMLDLTKIDKEELVESVHYNITKLPNGGNDILAIGGVIEDMENSKIYIYNSNMQNYKYKEDGISGTCDFGGSKEVKSYVNDIDIDIIDIEVQYNKCMFSENKGLIDGYMKVYYNDFVTEIIYKNYIEEDKWNNIEYNYIDYHANFNRSKGKVVATGDYSYEHEVQHSYYQYEMSVEVGHGNNAMASYNMNGYRTFGSYEGHKYVKVEVSNMISDIYPKPSECRTSGLINLTGKNNSKVTIQYNADRSMDFTLNGKKEHWFNCLHKNP